MLNPDLSPGLLIHCRPFTALGPPCKAVVDACFMNFTYSNSTNPAKQPLFHVFLSASLSVSHRTKTLIVKE